MPRHAAWLAAAVLAALTIAGCSAPAGDDTTSRTPASPAASSPDEQPGAADGPLQQYRSLVDREPPADKAAQQHEAEQNNQVEEAIAACMAAEGFDYVPKVDGTPTPVSGDEGTDLWRPDDRGWVERYGYGLTDNPYTDLAASAEPGPVDPNEAYLDGLTDAERQAYDEALTGRRPPADDEDEGSAPTLADLGCMGRAESAVRGERPALQQEDREIAEAIQAFDEELWLRPEFDAIDAAWAQCMTRAGFEGFTRQPDALEAVFELEDDYWRGRSPKDDPDLGTTRDPEYAAIGDREVTLALADLTCRETIDCRRQQLTIRFALEEQFIADHSEALTALANRLDPER